MRKTLLSFLTKAMFVCAFVLFSQTSFSQIFRFDFENSTNVTLDNAVGTPTFTTNGVTNAGYTTTNPCLNARMRVADNWDTGDYYRFNVNTTGYGNMVFSVCGRADATTIGTFIIRGSADNGANWVTLVPTFTPGTTNETATSIVFPESLNNQSAVIIELYKSNNANSNNRILYIDNAVLTGNATPLVTSFTPAGPVCTGTNITITGSNFTGATGVAINGTAVSSFVVNSATSITATIAAGTTAGTVRVSNDYGYGTSAASLTFNPSPSEVTATASANVICTGGTINLTASANSNVTTPTTILTQNFNAATNNWIKVNNSTGGTVGNAAWTLRPNNYNPAQAISSNDATQFYLSNSDAQGNGTTTATILQSPSFSTVGLASASLNFYHYLRYNNGETARVRVSTDGTNWDTLETYESTQGARTNFAQGTFSLNSYLGQATVYVRFEYNATYDWYWAIDNVTISGTTPVAPTYAWTSVPAGFTSNVQNPTNVAPTVNTIYTVTVTNSHGCTTTASTATVNVNPTSVAGAVSANQTICSGSQPANITIAASTGTIQWQSSTDNNTYNNIAGQTTNTLSGATIGNLTATRYYRAVVTSGVCNPVNSGVVTVTVNPTSVAGAVSANQTICSGSQPANITIAASTGTIQWQSSTDNNTYNNIAGQTTNTLSGATIGNLTATRYYRAVVTSGVCASVNSAVVTVTVDPVTVGGTVAGSTTVCAAGNSGNLTLSGHVGTITKWQSSDLADFSAGVLDIPNTSTTLSYLNIAATTYYRAVVTSGVCGSVNSSVAVVNVDNVAVGGNISGSVTVCYGNNSGSLTLSGQSGTIAGWESSLDNFATAGTPINNTTNTLNYLNLTGTTYYRAMINSGTCPAVYSTVAAITADVNSIWTGANSTSWNDAANWSCGVVPTTDIHVTISAVTNQPIVSAAAFANTLTMETGTTLTVQSGSSLTVEDAINGQGTAVLTVENNAHLIQVNDVDNTINAVVKKSTNPLMRLDYILWSSPVAGQNLLSFSPATNTNRFYIYNPSTDLYNTVVPSSTTFAEGTGYLIRMPNTHPTTPTVWNGTFSGVLNNGDVDVAVANNTYNAIGNPYPSAIDADLFISENNLTEALYFWRKTNNDQTTSYATYTAAGGVGTSSNGGGDPMLLTPDGTIMPGQGFIAKSTSTTLSFNNGMRTGNNGQFFRTNQIERNRIWLNLTNAAGIFSQTMVSYMTGATQGVDATIDGLYFNDSQLALTSIIGEAEYAIQGRALPFANTDIVPLGFKAIDAGTYTIGLDHADGLFADVSQPILLKDNTDGSVHDLRLGNYSFASAAGVFNGRFELVYQNTTLAVNNPIWDANQVVVYKSGQDVVVHTGNVKMDQVKIFDIRGRLLASKDNVRSSETKLFAGTTNQVLIVKVISEDQKEVTRKIVN